MEPIHLLRTVTINRDRPGWMKVHTLCEKDLPENYYQLLAVKTVDGLLIRMEELKDYLCSECLWTHQNKILPKCDESKGTGWIDVIPV